MTIASQGLFPWSRGVPYDWSRWFAWYPVKLITGKRTWMRFVQCRAHGEIVPNGFEANGDLTDWYEFRAPKK